MAAAAWCSARLADSQRCLMRWMMAATMSQSAQPSRAEPKRCGLKDLCVASFPTASSFFLLSLIFHTSVCGVLASCSSSQPLITWPLRSDCGELDCRYCIGGEQCGGQGTTGICRVSSFSLPLQKTQSPWRVVFFSSANKESWGTNQAFFVFF